MKNGDKVRIRLICAEDEPLLRKFHATLSERSVYMRYFYHMTLSARTSHERLSKICAIDYRNEIVIVTERMNSRTHGPEIIAVGRLNKLPDASSAEFAVLVIDSCQGQGLGTELLNRLLSIAQRANIKRVIANILPENKVMKRISEKLNFPVNYKIEKGVVIAEIVLTSITQENCNEHWHSQ
ncbi:MAG: GNAT family N-acetyltransferase [bacterium]